MSVEILIIINAQIFILNIAYNAIQLNMNVYNAERPKL